MKTKILDCTIRDGGYLNNWGFDTVLVKDLYRAVSKTGVDYIEIGFRSTDKYFDPSEVGIWRFTPEETVEDIVSNVAGAPISLMIDFGKADISDIPEAVDSKITIYRIATHKSKIPEAIDFANEVADKGYETALQLMGIVGFADDDFARILTPLKESRLTYVYFADSYGSLLPQDIEKYILILRETGKALGFHPHNNMQLAFSNTLAAISAGIDIVDGTVFGMGRGAGNLPLETLIAYCQKTVDENKYNVLPILDLINRYFIDMMAKHPWGYNLPYMISGVYEVHPNYAKALTDAGEYTINEIQDVLQLIHHLNPVGFDKNIVHQIVQTGFIGKHHHSIEKEKEGVGSSATIDKPAYINRHTNRDFLILANGSSLVMYRDAISRFIDKYDPIIIGSNYLGDLFTPHYHSFNNRRLFEKHVHKVHTNSKLLLCNSLQHDYIRQYTQSDYELIQQANNKDIFDIKDGVIQNDYRAISVLSIAVAIVMGAKRVFIAGMDGYKDMDTFFAKGFPVKNVGMTAENTKPEISNRSGTYSEQMEWHNYIEMTLGQINDYLISRDMNDLIIITPTTHKLYYESIDNFLELNEVQN